MSCVSMEVRLCWADPIVYKRLDELCKSRLLVICHTDPLTNHFLELTLWFFSTGDANFED